MQTKPTEDRVLSKLQNVNQQEFTILFYVCQASWNSNV